jgi:hypothetical protein
MSQQVRLGCTSIKPVETDVCEVGIGRENVSPDLHMMWQCKLQPCLDPTYKREEG